MIEHTGVTVLAGQSGLAGISARSGTRGDRKVAGKSQLAVSALGMCVMLALLLDGEWLAAIAAFLLTVGFLEMMFQRALARFHQSSPLRARRTMRGALNRREAAAAGD